MQAVKERITMQKPGSTPKMGIGDGPLRATWVPYLLFLLWGFYCLGNGVIMFLQRMNQLMGLGDTPGLVPSSL